MMFFKLQKTVMPSVLAKSVKSAKLMFLMLLLVAISIQSNISYADDKAENVTNNVTDNKTNNQVLLSPNWQEYSQGIATWMWFEVYQAALFIDANSRLDSALAGETYKLSSQQLLAEERSLKLQLCYAREVTPKQFIEGANHVLPGNLSPALKKQVEVLHNAYQTVKKGDCYSLIYNNQTKKTQLKLNDKLVFSTNLKGFKQVYFGIWIGDNPLSSRLKNALLKKT